MASNFTNVVNVIVSQNIVVGFLTLLITGAYLIFLGLNNVAAAEQIKSFVDLLIGFWVAKVGTGIAVAQQVEKQVTAQQVKKDKYGQ